MAIKRLILHLGITKTGSSSIQDTLYNNSEALEKNGFRYLNEWGMNHIYNLINLFRPYPTQSLGRLYFNKKILDDDIEKAQRRFIFGKSIAKIKHKKANKKLINKMLKVIDTTECETLIISGVYFHHLYLDSIIENIKTFLNKYFISKDIEVKFILFVRNPLSWMISYLQQNMFAGSYTRPWDYYESRERSFKGIFNLKKYFPDSITYLKFEDAINDKDGLVGFFLKSIGFPQKKLQDINISSVNESRCMEAVEFAQYIEDKEPRIPFGHYGPRNPNRIYDSFGPLKIIKGAKYDISFNDKLALWERLSDTVNLLKTETSIDYTNYKITQSEQETYSEETIQGFLDAFPKLGLLSQKYFLKFFEKKYFETLNKKYLKLYFDGSLPKKIYAKSKKKHLKNFILNIKILLNKIKTVIKFHLGW